MVERILFDTTGTQPRAGGIELSSADLALSRYRVSATREVILCAGSVASPQLLLLSGVGPASELQALEIPVVKDLPAVGKHLSDVSLSYAHRVNSMDTMTD